MYGAAFFLLLVLFAKLPVEHRTLDCVSVYRYGLLAFVQEYLYCVTVCFEVCFNVSSQQTTVIVGRDVEQDAIALTDGVQQLCPYRPFAVDCFQIVHHVSPFLLENEIGSTAVPRVEQKIYGVTMFHSFAGCVQQSIVVAIELTANRIDCCLSFNEVESPILGDLLQLLDELDAR